MMDRSIMNHKHVKDKSQKESHSEIERKRRERMKMETEFLHRQVPHSQCKDKLSIFLAGAERLIHYTDKLGKREYIINDEEYSRIIMNNIHGFGIRVRCSDGQILFEENAQKILDIASNSLVGKVIYDLAEPSFYTQEIIRNSFMVYNSESQQIKCGELIARNFVIALHCGPSIPLRHCIRGSDNKIYRFIEFCGDLVYHNECDDSEPVLVFRGLCRPLDPACSTILKPPNSLDSACSLEDDDYSNQSLAVTSNHITLRLSPDHYTITEVVGNISSLLGYCAKDLLDRHMEDFVVPSQQISIRNAIEEAILNGSVTKSFDWLWPENKTTTLLRTKLDAIRLNTCLYCIVCKLHPLNLDNASKIQKESNSSVYWSHVDTSQSVSPHSSTLTSNFPNNSTSTRIAGSITKLNSCQTNDSQQQLTKEENHTSRFKTKTVKLECEEQDVDSNLDLVSVQEAYADNVFSSKVGYPANDANYVMSREDSHGVREESTVSDFGEDWSQITLNSSLEPLFCGSEIPDLFHPDYLKDLLKEDVTDL